MSHACALTGSEELRILGGLLPGRETMDVDVASGAIFFRDKFFGTIEQINAEGLLIRFSELASEDGLAALFSRIQYRNRVATPDLADQLVRVRLFDKLGVASEPLIRTLTFQ